MYRNRNWLYNQYWNQGKTLTQIANKCGVVPSVPQKWMKKLNIATRPSRFIEGHTTNVGRKFTAEQIKIRYKDENNPRWKGGKKNYYNRQARRAWEEYWREEVPKGYCVHHVDEDITNQNICNLALLTISFHMKLHNEKRRTNVCYN